MLFYKDCIEFINKINEENANYPFLINYYKFVYQILKFEKQGNIFINNIEDNVNSQNDKIINVSFLHWHLWVNTDKKYIKHY